MVTYRKRSHLATVVVGCGSSTETVGSKYRSKLVKFRYRYQLEGRYTDRWHSSSRTGIVALRKLSVALSFAQLVQEKV